MAKLIVKEIIKEKGLTGTEVARKMGISPAAFSLAINGNPTLETLDLVAKALEVEIPDLFRPSNILICPKCGAEIELNPKERE